MIDHTHDMKEEAVISQRIYDQMLQEKAELGERIKDLNDQCEDLIKRLEISEKRKNKLDLDNQDLIIKLRISNELKNQLEYYRAQHLHSEKKRLEAQDAF